MRSIVTRLDGLPLAIELAAAKVRAMAIEEIDRRLEDRFALLRGGDRGAPDRHQTLLAVIDWSWNLIDEAERRALRRLALFNDGFTLEAADAVLGDGALDAVQGLVDQSLLSVRGAAGGVRYRMLETVREFGRLQLERRRRGRRGARGQAGLGDRVRGPPPRRPVRPRPVRDDRRDRRRGGQPRRRAARRARRRRPPRPRRAALRARALLDDPRRARSPDRPDGRGRRRGSRLAAAAGARGHRARRAGDDDDGCDGHGRPAQRADPGAAGAARAGRRRPAADRDGLDAARVRPGGSGRVPCPARAARDRSRPPRRAARAPVARPRARERRRPRGRGRGGRGRTGAGPRRRGAVDGGAAPHPPRRPDGEPRRHRGRRRARPRRPAGDGAAGGDG